MKTPSPMRVAACLMAGAGFVLAQPSCPPGSYFDGSACKPADPGFYVPVAGATSQTMCAAGTYTPSPGATAPILASPGFFVARPASSSQTQCPPGTYTAGEGSVAPSIAQPGFFVAAAGATSQTQCAPGFYTPNPGMTAPLAADPGFYVPSPGAAGQIEAPAGTYAAGPGATEAVPVPAGYFAAAGAATPTICPPGFFTSSAGSAEPTAAPPGTFVATPGATAPTPTPAGTYAEGPAATAATPAPPGTYSEGNAAAPIPCPPGYFTPTPGMASPLAAPPGYYVPGAGATSPTIVPPGHYAAGPAATGYTQCPAGYYAPAGSAAPILCPGGFYAPAGSGAPIVCPAGYFAPPGSAEPVLSPADFYAPEGSAAPIYCPGSPAGSSTCTPNQSNGLLDFGDLGDTPYPTKLPNGARHTISEMIFLGQGPPDPEPDGLAGAAANGDDSAAADDEDSVDPRSLHAYKGQPFRFSVRCTNTTGSTAFLNAFADWNNDGDFSDANEVVQVAVASPATGVPKIVTFNVPAGAMPGSGTALRLRFSTDNGVAPDGLASNGEVEDYLLTVSSQETDWGDLPDSVAGSAAGAWGSSTLPDYRTRGVDNGPSHPIISGLSFANDATGSMDRHIDGEIDGQPTSGADGDNISGDDDESIRYFAITSMTTTLDGPRTRANLTMLANLAVENISGATAYGRGFIDTNDDGDFDDPGEQSPPVAVPGDGSVSVVNLLFSFSTPPIPSGGTRTFTHAVRFRISTDPSLGSVGPATNGEVEDGLVSFSVDIGNYEEKQDWGDLPVKYPTLLANNGARHTLSPDLTLGITGADDELNGVPGASARGDDAAGTVDDEDGFDPAGFYASPGMSGAGVDVRLVNHTGSPAQVSVFIDWNNDGDFHDADEVSRVVEPTGTFGPAVVSVPFNVPSSASTTQPLAMRIRLSTSTGLAAGGAAPDGEVEDYFINLAEPRDYGDLPWPYPTMYAENGARHTESQTLFIGANMPDTERDGRPRPSAQGDDAAGTDDEDAFAFPPPPAFIAGGVVTLPVPVTNATGGDAFLTLFADWDGSGTFTPGETHVLTVAGTGAQTATFNLSVPLGTSTSAPLAVRLRLSTTPGLAAFGAAPDGEVEDHMFNVEPAAQDFGDLPDGYKTTLTNFGPQHASTGRLFLGTSAPDGEADGQPDTTATGDDAAGSDDEDALAATLVDARLGFDLKFIVTATNDLAETAYLHTFVDWDGDGVFNNATESVRTDVPAGSHAATVNPMFRVPMNASTTSPIAVRLRLSTQEVLASTGPAPDGEVEDFFIPPARQIIDYGDLQDASTLTSGNGTSPGVVTDLSTVSQGDYRTMMNDLGPRHIARQDLAISLESQAPESAVDGEDDAHPSALADGDNNDKPALPNGGGPPVIGEDDEHGGNLLSAIIKQTFDPATLTFTIAYYGSIAIRNETGGPAYLSAFMDSNNDGDFDDTDESALTIGSGTATLLGAGLPNDRPDLATTYATPDPVIPPTAPGTMPAPYGIVFVIKAQLPPTDTGIRGFTKKLPIRLRLSTTPGLGPVNTSLTDPIPDGEVEDHIITFSSSFDNPYPPPMDFGDLPAPYATLLADNGPSHRILTNFFLGALPADADGDGMPSGNALGDDATASDDEDGFEPAGATFFAGMTKRILVRNTNVPLPGEPVESAYLKVFTDWNHDGDFADANEEVTAIVAGGFANQDTAVDLIVPATAVTGTPTAMRLRLTTDFALGPMGADGAGEVEDHLIDVAQPLDFADLPAPYKTTLAEDGPRHLITPAVFLGANQPDPEGDGAHSADAKADDNNATSDDEDVLLADYVDAHAGFDLHLQLSATNTSGVMAYLQAFADWNADGDFNDLNERSEVDVPPGSVNAPFQPKFRVPLNAVTTQPVAVRLRLSPIKNIGPGGLAPNGEVEDYFIAPPRQIIDFGDLKDNNTGTASGVVSNLSTVSQADYQTRLADGGPRHRARQDLNLNNDSLPADSTADGTVLNPLPVHVDGEADAHPNTDATGDNLDQPSAPNGGVATPPAFPGGDDEQILVTAIVKQTYDAQQMKFQTAIHGSVAVRNQTGSDAHLSAWLDANNDGDFNDPGETPLTIGTGTIFGSPGSFPNNHAALALSYATPNPVVPSSPASSTEYGFVFVVTHQLPPVDTGIRGWTSKLPLRIRLSTSANLGPNGINADNSIPDGEVEDYIISWTAAFDNPYPQSRPLPTQYDLRNWSRLVDRNSDTRFHGSLHFAGNPSQSFDHLWQFGDGIPLSLHEQDPLVPSFLLNYLGQGTVPYLHTARFGDGGIGSYLGNITIRNLGDYRAFMNQAGLTDENSVPMGDIDGDLIPNFDEFAFGSDPAASGSIVKLEHRVVDDGGRYFVAAYLRRPGGVLSGTDYSTPDVFYRPQGSGDMVAWDTPMEVPVAIPADLPAAPPGYEWGAVRLAHPIDGTHPRGFIRVLAEAP